MKTYAMTPLQILTMVAISMFLTLGATVYMVSKANADSIKSTNLAQSKQDNSAVISTNKVVKEQIPNGVQGSQPKAESSVELPPLHQVEKAKNQQVPKNQANEQKNSKSKVEFSGKTEPTPTTEQIIEQVQKVTDNKSEGRKKEAKKDEEKLNQQLNTRAKHLSGTRGKNSQLLDENKPSNIKKDVIKAQAYNSTVSLNQIIEKTSQLADINREEGNSANFSQEERKLKELMNKHLMAR